jgi:hypothetical protein
MSVLLKFFPLSAVSLTRRKGLVVVLGDHCQQFLPPQQLIYNTEDITMTLQKEIS